VFSIHFVSGLLVQGCPKVLVFMSVFRHSSIGRTLRTMNQHTEMVSMPRTIRRLHEFCGHVRSIPERVTVNRTKINRQNHSRSFSFLLGQPSALRIGPPNFILAAGKGPVQRCVFDETRVDLWTCGRRLFILCQM
jgi:hypothetical protein